MNIKSVSLKLDPNNAEHKKISNEIAEDLTNAIFHSRLLKKYKINEETKKRYEKDIAFFSKAKENGYLDFEYEDPEVPYESHYIHITWIADPTFNNGKDLLYNVPVKEMRKILKLLEAGDEDFSWLVTEAGGKTETISTITYLIYRPL